MIIAGIDLGATKIAFALFTKGGEIIFQEKIFLNGASGKIAGELLTIVAKVLIKKAGELGEQVESIGLSIPGIVYKNTGTVWVPNIAGWEDFPVVEQIKKGLGTKNSSVYVKIESDRVCHLLGEHWVGKAKGVDNSIFITVGTGIGAGIMTNGRIIRGVNDISGAIGWMALTAPYENKYDERGCFETHASGYGLVKMVKELIASGIPSKYLNKERLSGEDIFGAYSMRDPVAVEVIKNAIQYWGMASANLVSLLNPEMIIFGGGIFGPAIKFIPNIYEEAKKWAQPISIQNVKFTDSQLGVDTGLIGAGYLALNNDYK
ncbi:MAG: ROK family protein [Cyclobacteriaceae bacterium]|nr:ROK family protein [Cyclobacteriaceae bacterium]